MASEEHTNEVDVIVKYANVKGGGADGQVIIDSVELERSRDNRIRHGIGNDNPQEIERGNNEYTFSTTTYMGLDAAQAVERIYDGAAVSQAVYVRDPGNWKQQADGMVFNTVNVSVNDDGDATVDIDADLLGISHELLG